MNRPTVQFSLMEKSIVREFGIETWLAPVKDANLLIESPVPEIT